MVIKALYPAKINFPHLGEATVDFLTHNTIIWTQVNNDVPYMNF